VDSAEASFASHGLELHPQSRDSEAQLNAANDLVEGREKQSAGLDRDDFHEIYERHHRAVFNTVRMTCGDDLAADVTQEAFIRLWQRPEQFDPIRGTMRSYLLAMARNIAVDSMRSEHARRRREEADRRAVDYSIDNIDQHLLQTETTTAVVGALNQLKEVQRQALTIVCYGQCTYREAATVLGIPEGTIKSRIRLGLQHLGSILLAPGDELGSVA